MANANKRITKTVCRHTKFQMTLLTVALILLLPAAAHALSGTYVVLTKGGGGVALTFSEKGTFNSVALASRNAHKYYSKGKYSVSGNALTLTTSKGVGTLMIESNGDLYDKATNVRFHRYYPRKQKRK
jgi:hypothetical protein